VDAYDISTASLARAAERIKTHCGTTERCRFLPIDLNKYILPEAAYDAMLINGTIGKRITSWKLGVVYQSK
jgi:hypothetical protein